MNIHHCLTQIDLFKDVPHMLLDQLAEIAFPIEAKRHDLIFHHGTHAEHWYIVYKGCCRLVQHTALGQDVTMAIFVPCDVVGFVVAAKERVYPGTFEALKDSTLIRFPSEIAPDIAKHHPDLLLQIIEMVNTRLQEAHQRIRELSSEPAPQRIARAILRLINKTGVKDANGLIHLDIRLSRQDIAQMSGTTLETVSRTLKQWEHKAIVQSGRERIIIVSYDKLVQLSEV